MLTSVFLSLSVTRKMERKEGEKFPDSIEAATGMTVRIGQIYSAFVNQLQRRVNVYATAFFRTFQGDMLVATRPVGSTDRLLYMPDELGPPDTSKEKLPPSGTKFVEDIVHGVIGHAVASAERSIYVPPSDFTRLPEEGPSETPEKKPRLDLSSSLPSSSRAVARPPTVEAIVEDIEERRKKEIVLVEQFLMEELRQLDSDVAEFATEPFRIVERDRFYKRIIQETMNRAMPFIPVGEALHSQNRALLRDNLLRLFSGHDHWLAIDNWY